MTCVRGVAALDEMLARKRDAKVAVLVVWEHVGDKPIAPAANDVPPASVARRVGDPRATQFWDPRDLTSDALRAAGMRSDEVLWDLVVVYPPGAKWDATPPPESYAGGDVLDVIPEIERRL